ncbi:hypothetical protein PRK78_002582 [Emydomyces testavorans]|uniref:Uncharacterized protein n=1 Tax=Emydomyces testavorans TaxID=2070801 RepID=A0AAF0DEK0_9EURO|nr:hypothetical protein PRK78_002582 [Emydomyces testavorans]
MEDDIAKPPSGHGFNEAFAASPPPYSAYCGQRLQSIAVFPGGSLQHPAGGKGWLGGAEKGDEGEMGLCDRQTPAAPRQHMGHLFRKKVVIPAEQIATAEVQVTAAEVQAVNARTECDLAMQDRERALQRAIAAEAIVNTLREEHNTIVEILREERDRALDREAAAKATMLSAREALAATQARAATVQELWDLIVSRTTATGVAAEATTQESGS